MADDLDIPIASESEVDADIDAFRRALNIAIANAGTDAGEEARNDLIHAFSFRARRFFAMLIKHRELIAKMRVAERSTFDRVAREALGNDHVETLIRMASACLSCACEQAREGRAGWFVHGYIGQALGIARLMPRTEYARCLYLAHAIRAATEPLERA